MKPFGNLASIGRQLTREERIQVAWDNVPSLFGYSILKLDCDNRLISQYEYGKTSRFGWEIDHTIPIFLGGSDAHGICGRGIIWGSRVQAAWAERALKN